MYRVCNKEMHRKTFDALKIRQAIDILIGIYKNGKENIVIYETRMIRGVTKIRLLSNDNSINFLKITVLNLYAVRSIAERSKNCKE